MSQKALLVIDLQNDYFPGGAFPLWQADQVKDRLVESIQKATKAGMLVVHVQHIADKARGIAPFFNEGTEGAAIHPDILAAAPEAPVVIKHYADSFEQTDLKKLLTANGIDELLVCGMMTQNCVTHTAISKAAEAYKVTIVSDLCTTVSEILHLIALNAVSTRMKLASAKEVNL